MARNAPRRLYRSATERMLGGVCGGLADYFDVDPVLMRLVFVAGAVLSGGVGLPLYLVLWIIVPKEGDDAASRAALWRQNADEMVGEARRLGSDLRETIRPGVAESGRSGMSDPVTSGGSAEATGRVAEPGAPADPESARATTEPIYSTPVGVGPAPDDPEPYVDDSASVATRRQTWAGAILVILGLWLLADNFNLLRWVRGDLIWALILIGIGGWLLLRQSRGRA